MPPGSSDIDVGYQLALTTCRVLLMMKPGIELARQMANTKPGPNWENEAAAMVSTYIRGLL